MSQLLSGDLASGHFGLVSVNFLAILPRKINRFSILICEIFRNCTHACWCKERSKPATACSPLQADNGGREGAAKFLTHCWKQNILGHTVTNPVSLSPPGKHPLSWFLDILLTMPVQTPMGLTQSELQIQGRKQTSGHSQRRSGLREQSHLRQQRS